MAKQIALLFASVAFASAQKIITVPGENNLSIQDAINNATAGDTILVDPGTYRERGAPTGANSYYGLRVSTDDLLIQANGPPGSVILEPYDPSQRVGVYAAPLGCDEYGQFNCTEPTLKGFAIRGFQVENFEKNGIQVRWGTDFVIEDCISWNNKDHGFIASMSSFGSIVLSNSSGSTENAGILIDASDHVDLLSNTLHENKMGIQAVGSKNVYVACNQAFNNTVGVAILHPNFGQGDEPMIPNEPLNFRLQNNHVYGNNYWSPSFSIIPPGFGILAIGVQGITAKGNNIKDNDISGFGLAGYCTATKMLSGADFCDYPKNNYPAANQNTFEQNIMTNNGGAQTMYLPVPSNKDILYLEDITEFRGNTETNCFQDNYSPSGIPATHFANIPDINGSDLPTCTVPSSAPSVVPPSEICASQEHHGS